MKKLLLLFLLCVASFAEFTLKLPNESTVLIVPDGTFTKDMLSRGKMTFYDENKQPSIDFNFMQNGVATAKIAGADKKSNWYISPYGTLIIEIAGYKNVYFKHLNRGGTGYVFTNKYCIPVLYAFDVEKYNKEGWICYTK